MTITSEQIAAAIRRIYDELGGSKLISSNLERIAEILNEEKTRQSTIDHNKAVDELNAAFSKIFRRPDIAAEIGDITNIAEQIGATVAELNRLSRLAHDYGVEVDMQVIEAPDLRNGLTKRVLNHWIKKPRQPRGQRGS